MVAMKVQHLKVHGEDLEDSNLYHSNLEDKQINTNTIQYKLIRLCYYNNIFII
jgi:superfamily I DNA/RNA helicase